MKCPKCGETLKEDAKVCFSCGEDIKEHEVDRLINSMIKEDDAKASNNGKEKPVKKSESSTSKNKPGKAPKSNTSDKDKNKEKVKSESKHLVYGRAVQITRYVTALVVLILLISLLMDWFNFGGRGAFLGFAEDLNADTIQYLTEPIQNTSLSTVMTYDEDIELMTFSAKDLIDFTKDYGQNYVTVMNSRGEETNSLSVRIDLIYVKGFYLILIMAIISILMLIIDKWLATTEWVRGFSVLTLVIIVLNYIVLKVPFLSIFTLRSQSILRGMDNLSAVTINMNGINVNNDFYPYKLYEQQGFFLALGACVFWFILTTVLIEIKKDKELSEI